MKKELLSPAGDMESLRAAIHAGCDAVYIAGKKFGARKFSKNFTEDELVDAINYAHLYGVKVYVTVNTMIYEDEMKEVLEYIGFLYTNHVDAVIVQDIGLIVEIKKLYKDLEIHASTQAHNYSKENFDLLEELGVTRVVLAREESLEDIKNIKTNLEKEVFIHGAICISYSGQCLFSSFVLNRSGNRGECAGMCRLPYKLKNEDGYVNTIGDYLLSPRELCTIPRFKELMDSDIKCFKIEGRMKSAAYVYFVTKLYRMLIDKYERGEELEISREDYDNLLVLYNRKFTEGYLFIKKNDEFMNIESPNHQGISLGKVIKVTPKRIGIKLTRDLNQEDGIRFLDINKGMIVNFLYNEKDMLISSAKSGSVIYVDNKIGLTKPCLVVKTVDKELQKSLENYPLKKIPISMKFSAHLGDKMTLEVSDGVNTINLSGNIVERAIKNSTTEEEVLSKLNKLGDTPYVLDSVHINMSDNIFIPMGQVNHLRQDIIKLLSDRRIYRESVVIDKKYIPKIASIREKDVEICVLVRNEEQLLSVIDKAVARVYITDFSLYQKYSDKYPKLYYRENRLSKSNASRKMVTEFTKVGDNPSCTDYYLNVANTSYLEYLSNKNIENVTLSVEMKPYQIRDVVSKNNTQLKLEVMIYGKVELMLMKYSIHDMFNLDENKEYSLVDRNYANYQFIEEDNATHIFHSTPNLYTDEETIEIINSGVSYVRLEFLDESSEEVLNILEKYQQLIQKL